MVDRFADLSPLQREIVAYPTNAFVVAGPGSGKTEVLSWKVAYSLRHLVKPPFRVAAITFTNDAAAEMRRRVSKIAAEDAERASITTIHSFCLNTLVRPYVHHLGVSPEFEVIERKEQVNLAKTVAAENGLSVSGEALLAQVGQLKSGLVYPEAGKAYLHGSPEHLCSVYQQAMQKYRLVDFDDLIWYAHRILTDIPEAKHVVQTALPWFIIDEYQDTDLAQHRLLVQLRGSKTSFFAVGDPDQSIYRFRHTDPENINRFITDFAAKRFVLGANYRSPKVIAEAAVQLIAQNGVRNAQPELLGEGGDAVIYLRECTTSAEEATFIAQTLWPRLRERNIQPAQFAVFARNRDPLGQVIQEFKKAGIKYHFVDDLPYQDTPETRILAGAARFIGGDGSFDPLGEAVTNLSRLYPTNRVDFQAHKADVARNAAFIGLLQDARNKQERPFQAIGRLLRLYPLSDRITATEPSSRERARRHQQLDAIVKWIETCDTGNLENFLRAFDIQDAVRLMTVHGSKGLEFKVVSMVALEDGVLPSYFAVKSGKSAEIAEERRTMYVGLTRARETLVLTYAKERLIAKLGKYVRQAPSRFIAEIPEGLIKRIS